MVSPVFYQFDRLIILDQTLLPGEEKYIYLETKEDVWQAIKKLQVRGAPAIGVCAAYGVYVAIKDAPAYGFFDMHSNQLQDNHHMLYIRKLFVL